MSALGFWRPKTSSPRIPPQPEAERDWAAGDLAKCIAPQRMGWQTVCGGMPAATEPRAGQIVRVATVHSAHGIVWLSFKGLQPYCFPAGHFRKLRPCSTDFREQLERRSPLTAPRALPELVQ